MHEIRYMTPTEEIEYPYSSGLVDPESTDISIRKDIPMRSKARVLRHEIGHTIYPTGKEIPLYKRPVDWEEFHVLELLDELTASYFSLGIEPRDSGARSKIRGEKIFARERGMSARQIKRIDALARERTGYTRRSVR